MKSTILFLAGILCLSLGACGDEPSESAMRDAASATLARLYQGQAAAAAYLAGGLRGGSIPPAPAVTSFRKVGCVPAQPKAGYACDFQIALNGVDRGTNRGRFYPTPGGGLEMGD